MLERLSLSNPDAVYWASLLVKLIGIKIIIFNDPIERKNSDKTEINLMKKYASNPSDKYVLILLFKVGTTHFKNPRGNTSILSLTETQKHRGW